MVCGAAGEGSESASLIVTAVQQPQEATGCSRGFIIAHGGILTAYKQEEDHEKAEEKAEAERDEKKSAGKGTDTSTHRQKGQPLSRGALGGRGDRRRAKSPQRTDAAKGLKHPFALYGWGEKQTDTGSQKTHNVCASASVNEIHESALRAKNRRQVEKRKLSQRRIHSAEVDRTWKAKSAGPDNPWMTEYMRCYSARAR